jgi:hypothetical protein
VILCALAFNLTFFLQELWLVIPKALTPGLHPDPYHNDHDWTGHAPTLELLQGTGALATFASDLAFSIVLAAAPGLSLTWRPFLFWMAFKGLYQSLTQLALGALLPANDVGRALAYLQIGEAPRLALLACAVAAMGLAGAWLARQSAEDDQETAPTAILAVALIIPFRVPRDIIEVMLIPLFVNLDGAGWLTLDASCASRPQAAGASEHAKTIIPAMVLALTLLLFQLVLRPGVTF